MISVLITSAISLFQRDRGCSVFFNESWYEQIYQRQMETSFWLLFLERSSAVTYYAVRQGWWWWWQLRKRDCGFAVSSDPCLEVNWWCISLPLGLLSSSSVQAGPTIINHIPFLALGLFGALGFSLPFLVSSSLSPHYSVSSVTSLLSHELCYHLQVNIISIPK